MSRQHPTQPALPGGFDLVPSSKAVKRRNAALVRQWALLRLLGRSQQTIEGLAAELEVTTRTIRRDLAALEEAHFPLVQGKIGNRSYWWLPGTVDDLWRVDGSETSDGGQVAA